MSKVEARRKARERAVKVRQEREDARKRELAERARLEREQDKAIESDMIGYFEHADALESEAREYQDSVAAHNAALRTIVNRMIEREGNAKPVADMLGISAAKLSTLRKGGDGKTPAPVAAAAAGE